MKKLLFFASLTLAFILSSCSDETQIETTDNQAQTGLINKTAQIDGVTYSLKDVAFNSKVIALNTTNSSLIDAKDNIFKIEVLSDASANLFIGNTLYLQTGDTTYLKTIKNIQTDGSYYTIETEDAGLGDLFESGSLELSVDVEEAENALKRKSSKLKSAGFENGITFDVLNAIGEYQNDGFAISPNTSVKAFFNVTVGFTGKLIKTPNEIVVTYELETAFNPYLTFAKSVNRDYQTDLINLVPENLIDILKSIEIEVDLPLGDLGTLPAKISISDIKFPMNVVANLSKEADLQFNANGTFKVGYAYYKNVAGKSSHQIYENTMIVSGSPGLNLHGEILSDAKIIITPNISLVDASLLKVSSDIIFGLNTETSGGIETLTQKYIGGSKGTFYSEGKISVSTLGLTLFTTELFKETTELWNIGSFDKTLTLSNLVIAKPSKTICALRSYNYEMTVDYKYPVLGKTISNEIEITYDVYDDSNKLLAGGQKITLTPYNVTSNSFTFNLCVPFKVDVLAFTSGFTKKTAYIKNIKVTDAFGNEATGIAGSNEIMLGSPYNTSVWK
jgi:hypothetical protein